MEAAQDLRSTSKDIDLSETKTADQPRSHTEHKVTRAERVRMSVAKNSLPPINRKPIEPSLPSTPETLRQKKNDITQPALTSTPKVLKGTTESNQKKTTSKSTRGKRSVRVAPEVQEVTSAAPSNKSSLRTSELKKLPHSIRDDNNNVDPLTYMEEWRQKQGLKRPVLDPKRIRRDTIKKKEGLPEEVSLKKQQIMDEYRQYRQTTLFPGSDTPRETLVNEQNIPTEVNDNSNNDGKNSIPTSTQEETKKGPPRVTLSEELDDEALESLEKSQPEEKSYKMKSLGATIFCCLLLIGLVTGAIFILINYLD
eukprot:m.104578 g.104578  ORF g.104578 m.104578 type:complete len:310 (-) comp13847_c0_seq2:948-1877(-)